MSSKRAKPLTKTLGLAGSNRLDGTKCLVIQSDYLLLDKVPELPKPIAIKAVCTEITMAC